MLLICFVMILMIFYSHLWFLIHVDISSKMLVEWWFCHIIYISSSTFVGHHHKMLFISFVMILMVFHSHSIFYDVLQAPMVCCCLHKHVCKMASWPLDFAIGVPITNRTNLDLVRPSVHYPLLPAPCPLWIPYGQPHSGFLAGKHSLQVLFYIAEKTTAKSADGHDSPIAGLCGSL